MAAPTRGSILGQISLMERALSSSHRENEAIKEEIQKLEEKLVRVEVAQASFRYDGRISQGTLSRHTFLVAIRRLCKPL